MSADVPPPLDADPATHGRIGYTCLKRAGGDEYYHLATAADDDAVAALQSRDFFTRYTELTEGCAVGEVDVTPLELIAETR